MSRFPGLGDTPPQGYPGKISRAKTWPRHPCERRREGPRGQGGHELASPGAPRTDSAPALSSSSSCPPGLQAPLCPGGAPEPWAFRITTPQPLRAGRWEPSARRQSLAQQFALRESVPPVPSGRTNPRFPSPRALIWEGNEEGREKKYFFSKKGENSHPQTPEVFENCLGQAGERDAVSFCSSAKKNMFSFYGFCKSIRF